MSFEKLLDLLRAVEAGKIYGEASADVLGIHPVTFWRWVKEARRRGVVFVTNPRGDVKNPRPWRVRAYGPFKRMLRR